MFVAFLRKQDDTFTGKQRLTNGAHICQIVSRFVEIQRSCLAKFSSFRVGETEWQIFHRALCTGNFWLGTESLVKSTPGVNSTNIYKQLNHRKVLCAAFLNLQCRVVIFWQNNFRLS